MFRLAHISDIHLGPLPRPSRRELTSKRLTGYINWQRNRSGKKSDNTETRIKRDNITDQLLDYMSALKPDHVAITGDMINLGLDEEIGNAQNWLKSLGKAEKHSLVLGNHDAYVHGAFERALASWQNWLVGDEGKLVHASSDFPTVRRRKNIALIACNSAIATASFMATGKFSKDDGERLAAILEEEGKAGNFRCVLIHHAPFEKATPMHKRLIGMRHFKNAIKKSGAELILHGHTHLWTKTHIPGKNGNPVPVCCVPAAYQWPGYHKPAAGLNLFNINRKNDTWQITLERHGLNDQTRFELIENFSPEAL